MVNYNSSDVPLPSADVGFSGAVHNRTRWDDNITWFNIPDKVVVTLRFFGPVYVVHNHWFATKKGKKFPLVCAAYDSATQSFAKGKCPVEDDFNIPLLVEEAKRVNPLFNEETDPNLKEIKAIKAHMSGFGHVIVRQNFQSHDRGASRPWQAIKLQPSVLFSLIKLKSMNRCNINSKVYEADVADPYWGRDVHIMYNSSEKNPQARYTITLGDHTPLTDVEKTYISQLYNWKEIIEYPSFDEVKQVLNINGYYTMSNQLKGAQSFGDTKQNNFAHMEQYLPQVPKSPYDNQQMIPQQVPSMPTMQNNFPPMPQQSQLQPPMPQVQTMPQMQVPMQQMQVPMQQMQVPMQQMQVPMQQMQLPVQYAPNPVTVGYGGGLVEADIPETSPLPTNVPTVSQDDLEIPFGEPVKLAKSAQQMQAAPMQQAQATHVQQSTRKTYSVKGRPHGVTPEEFQTIVSDFGNNLPRGKPFKASEDAELEGLHVLACYGSYCGDLNCVKCPLRSFCLHA